LTISTRSQFLLVLAFAITALAALTLYEWHALHWYPVREEPAGFTPYHLAHIAFSALTALLLVTVLARSPDRDASAGSSRLLPAERGFAIANMLSALLLTALCLRDPSLFHRMSLEDGIVETSRPSSCSLRARCSLRSSSSTSGGIAARARCTSGSSSWCCWRSPS
jgi:hypothetical protein